MGIHWESNLILLASPSPDTLTSWKQGVRGSPCIVCVSGLALLREELMRSKPMLLLLDYDLPGLHHQEGIADLKRLSPEMKIIVLNNHLSDESEWELFRAGVKGCCPKNIDCKQLKHVVDSVQQGELWIRRTLTSRLLDELGMIAFEKNQIKQAASDLLANLTRREHEIATLVGNGDSNKQIAQHLAITERTVKAHLTEIFRKLNVADRLKLALIVSGTFSSQAQMEENSSSSRQ